MDTCVDQSECVVVDVGESEVRKQNPEIVRRENRWRKRVLYTWSDARGGTLNRSVLASGWPTGLSIVKQSR
jgi:hypothetical protein